MMIDQKTVDQWLATRKEAGLKIDPETAEVDWNYAQTLDPYGVYPDLPEECQQVGREYFKYQWQITHKDLMRRFQIGRDKVYAIIGELRTAGYITKHVMQAPSGRMMGLEPIASDEPQRQELCAIDTA